MATYLICSTPVLGHVAPMLGIGRHLVSRGHRVIVLTGSRFADQVTSHGIEFRALSGVAYFDDRDLDSTLPDRTKYRGFAQIQYDIQTMFVNTIPAQLSAIRAILDSDVPDAILVDSAFVGAAPLLLDPAAVRPAILGIGVVPLSQSSRDVAPYGMGMAPSSTTLGRIRNRSLNLLATKVLFRKTQRSAEHVFAEIGGPPLKQFIMDISGSYDSFLQLAVQEFEYPRSDLPPNTRFIGPVLSPPSAIPVPEWWGDLDGSRPVVHVTQGTIDNHDLTRLIGPTVTGLAKSDVIVVVSSGGRPISDVGAVPANVRVAEFLPYELLMPLTDVYVTNGGFGGVQYALSRGVPMVVAGDTEDKPEVAARVSWSGTGINLRSGTPTAEAVRDAVLRVLAEPRFRDRATEFAESIAGHSALNSVETALSDAIALRA